MKVIVDLYCDILYDQFNGYPVYNIESSSLIILVIGTSMQVFTDTTTIWQTGKYLILTDLVWIRYKGTSLDINSKSFRDKSKDERYSIKEHNYVFFFYNLTIILCIRLVYLI